MIFDVRFALVGFLIDLFRQHRVFRVLRVRVLVLVLILVTVLHVNPDTRLTNAV